MIGLCKCDHLDFEHFDEVLYCARCECAYFRPECSYFRPSVKLV